MAQRITLDLLTEKGASGNLMKSFAELFPNGTEVTRQLCIRYAEEFDFDRAAQYLLPMQAWQRYRRTRGEAWAEYWAEYLRIQNKTWEECDRALDKVWAEYRRTCATEFARLWLEYMSD